MTEGAAETATQLEQLEITREAPEQQQEECASTSGCPSCFVITHSVAKKHNIGTIARCATAFGVKEMCLVGSRQFNSFGSHGADAHVAFRHFPTLEACCQHLKAAEGCEIIGVEIVEGAQPVNEHPFTGPVAFMLGNEGQGMTPRQMALCDRFVYIPQHGAGTASLNVAVACSIVLHHFALWAGYGERERQGHKFVVAPRPVRTMARGVAGDPEEIRAQRAAKQAAGEDEDEEGFAPDVFAEDEGAGSENGQETDATCTI